MDDNGRQVLFCFFVCVPIVHNSRQWRITFDCLKLFRTSDWTFEKFVLLCYPFFFFFSLPNLFLRTKEKERAKKFKRTLWRPLIEGKNEQTTAKGNRDRVFVHLGSFIWTIEKLNCRLDAFGRGSNRLLLKLMNSNAQVFSLIYFVYGLSTFVRVLRWVKLSGTVPRLSVCLTRALLARHSVNWKETVKFNFQILK